MKTHLLVLLAVISLVNFSSCDNGGEEEPDPCVSSSSVTGAVITDRYIVSLPSGDGDSGGRERNKGLSLLRRNNLSDERLITHFRGKNSIYVLNVTADEAAVEVVDQVGRASVCSYRPTPGFPVRESIRLNFQILPRTASFVSLV